MPIRPLQNNVIIRPADAAKKTPSGIILTTAAHEREQAIEGVIVALGSGRTTEKGVTIPPDFRNGERVLYLRHEAQEITLEGTKHHVVRDTAVLAVIG